MASSMGPAKMVTDGLVLHLDAGNNKSYPGSGTVWTDLSSTAITGSLTNGPTFSSTNGGSIFFDGTNDFVNLGNLTNLKFTNNFTLNLLIKFSSTTCIRKIISDNESGGIGIIANLDSSRIETFFYIGGSYYKAGDNMSNYDTVSWFNISATYDGSSVKFYRNGTLIESVSVSGTITTTSEPLILGANPQINGTVFGDYFNGNIAQVQIYNRALSANEVFQNYEATRERFNRPTIVTDDDARNFLNSANISSETQQRAVNDLVVDLKNVGLWGKMKAIYPFVGGTATSHKWNLKDPRDLDAAFRLTFSGGWTHSSTGALSNGSTAYATTYVYPSTNLTNSNFHLSFYSRTANNSNGYSAELCTNSNPYNPSGIVVLRVNDKTIGTAYFSGGDDVNEVAIGSSTTAGFAIGTETSATSRKFIKNNQILAINTTNSSTALTNNVLWVCYTGGGYAIAEAAFISIGDGLTDADATNLYTIVQKYQTTLGRQV